MVSHNPSKLDDHRHCTLGDIMFLVVEVEDFRSYPFNPPLLFISKENLRVAIKAALRKNMKK